MAERLLFPKLACPGINGWEHTGCWHSHLMCGPSHLKHENSCLLTSTPNTGLGGITTPLEYLTGCLALCSKVSNLVMSLHIASDCTVGIANCQLPIGSVWPTKAFFQFGQLAGCVVLIYGLATGLSELLMDKYSSKAPTIPSTILIASDDGWHSCLH